MPPGKTPALGPWIEREPAPRLATAPTSWLTLGGTVQVGADDSLGVRAELDLYTHDGWSFAAALAAGTSDFVGFSDTGNEFSVHTREARAVAMVTHTWSFRGWQLRLGGGVGAKYTTFTSVELFGQSDPTGDGAKLIAPTFEVSGLLAYTFDSGWAIGVGPVVTWYAEAGTAGRSNLELVRADLELMTFAGIRHRL
jgi:hypothetical protein